MTVPHRMTRVAVVQLQLASLDKLQALGRVVQGIDDAAHKGAELAVFPEAFVPGYPMWLWKIPPVMFKDTDPGDASAAALTAELRAAQLRHAVVIDNDLDDVRSIAVDRGVVVILGIEERDPSLSKGTLFNTVVTIDADGRIVNRHRKLMPTGPERMEWAPGDAAGLQVSDTAAGRTCALICWENYMPLARAALQAQGPEIYCAPTWDSGDRWIATARHIALESRCWVLTAGNAVRKSDLPLEVASADFYDQAPEWINPGDSVIVSPVGEVVAGPLHEEFGVIVADCDLNLVDQSKRSLDVSGHYSRPDIFQLSVSVVPRPMVTRDLAAAPAEPS